LGAVVFQFCGFVFITVIPLLPRSAPSSLWNESDLQNDLLEPARHKNIATQLDLFGPIAFRITHVQLQLPKNVRQLGGLFMKRDRKVYYKTTTNRGKR